MFVLRGEGFGRFTSTVLPKQKANIDKLRCQKVLRVTVGVGLVDVIAMDVAMGADVDSPVVDAVPTWIR